LTPAPEKPTLSLPNAMLNCSIKGCKETHSEVLGDPAITKFWFRGKPEVWEQLAAAGMHTEITLCPRHRAEVFCEVVDMRKTQQN
jgi:hypothetical protein